MYEYSSYKKYDNKLKIVGWNHYCKDLYSLARDKFLTWHINGRIRHGAIFDNMKSSRNNFKNALKLCSKNELKIRKYNLSTNLIMVKKLFSEKSWENYMEIRIRIILFIITII